MINQLQYLIATYCLDILYSYNVIDCQYAVEINAKFCLGQAGEFNNTRLKIINQILWRIF